MPTPPPDSHPREYGNNNDGHGWKTPKGSRVNKKNAAPKRKPVKKTKRARKISPARQPNFNSTTTLRARANSYSEMLEKMEHLNEARAMGEPGYAEVELKRKN